MKRDPLEQEDILVPLEGDQVIDVNSLPLSDDSGSEFYTKDASLTTVFGEIIAIMSTHPWKTADLIGRLPTFQHLASVTKEKNTFKAIAKLKKMGMIVKCGTCQYKIVAPGLVPTERRSNLERRSNWLPKEPIK